MFVFAAVNSEGAWFETSRVAAMILPGFNLVMSPFFALLALLTADAKLSVRGGAGGSSIDAQLAFRAASVRLLAWVAITLCLLMALVSWHALRWHHAGGPSGPDALFIGLASGVLVIFWTGCLVRMIRKYGQGGALIEHGSAEAPLTNGLADNTHWFAGLFFVDRADPSMMVEKRFGLGYTFNYGNWKAVLLVLTVLAANLGLIATALSVLL